MQRARRIVAKAGASQIGRRALFGGIVALAACAPLVRGATNAQTPLAGLSKTATRPELRADSFVSYDGAKLPLKVWPAEGEGQPWAVVVGMHGFNDTAAESFCLAGPAWAKAGVATYAYDQRGFGGAPERGRWAGEYAMTQDLRTLCDLVRQRHPKAVLAVAGESMGGAVAISAFGSDRPPSADRLVLLSPAVWGWDRQPALNAASLKLLGELAPSLALSVPRWVYDDDTCTDNAEMLRRMDSDPGEITATRMDATCGLMDLMQSAERRLPRIRTKTLYLYGAHDTVIPAEAAFTAAATLGPNGRTGYYTQGWHLLARDRQADRVLGDVVGYLRAPDAALPSAPPPIPAPSPLQA
jgi:alpha-beta hydrolase superfamily lysophospholipase